MKDLWCARLCRPCVSLHPTRYVSSRRRIATGLLYIPSKPLEVHPKDPATLATIKFAKDSGRELLIYEPLQSHYQFPPAPPGVALALFSDYSSIKNRLDTIKLPGLPAVDAERWALEEALHAKAEADDEAEDRINMIEADEFELPAELRPQAMDDDIPWGDVNDAIQDSGYDEDGLDASDYQNALEDYDPYQNEHGIPNARTWIERDKKECLVGAKPRLYEGFDVSKDTSDNDYLDSEVWDSKPLGGDSELAPYLFLTKIPCKPPNSANTDLSASTKTDQDFLRMFHRYGYLTSASALRRISCFHQEDPHYPRWLLVQESMDFFAYDYPLKKREAEHWWRKNGWEGTTMEFFRLRGYKRSDGG